MEKIYVDKVICRDGIENWEKLYDLGCVLRNDGEEFISARDIDKIISQASEEIDNIDLIQKLEEVNIYVEVKFELDSSIYHDDKNFN